MTSDLSGDLDVNYTLPTSQASDPNAVCPPTKAEINDGLIGCALATIDLTSYSPVGAASAVLEYAGDSLFPPSPTLALGTRKAPVGGTVSVSDKPKAKTHWWVATLDALEALLGGGTSAPPTILVTLAGMARGPFPYRRPMTSPCRRPYIRTQYSHRRRSPVLSPSPPA